MNLLLFLSDNHNATYLGCYGHPQVVTPNLDRLAALGTRFTNCYAASALCCPCRAALATGRFPHQTGYWDNVFPYDGRVPSWMHRLREAGYLVVSIGKLHFRSSDDDNGFTEEIIPLHVFEGTGQLSNLLRWDGTEPPSAAQRKLYEVRVTDNEYGSDYQEYDARITKTAIEWLNRHAQAADRPWALVVSYTSPHPPLTVSRRLFELYDANRMPLPPQYDPVEWPRHPRISHLRTSKRFDDIGDGKSLQAMTAAYCALVTFLDEQIGQVLTAAKDKGLLDNTFVMYTSDHGELLGAHGLLGKYCLYDGAVKVPLVCVAPNARRGHVAKEICSHVDLFPTLLEACGVPPKEVDALSGVSLWPALRGEDSDRWIFAEYHATGSLSGAYMIRDDAWKLIYHVGERPQLFHMAADQDERADVLDRADARPHAERLLGNLRSVCDPEEVDLCARADQKRKAEVYGGAEEILKRRVFKRTPPPDVSPDWA